MLRKLLLNNIKINNTNIIGLWTYNSYKCLYNNHNHYYSTNDKQQQLNEVKALNDMATKLYMNGQYDQTIKCLVDSLTISKSIFGTNHTSVGDILMNLGYSSNAIGEYDNAISYYKEALEVFKYIFGSDNEYVGNALLAIGINFKSQNKFDEALSYFNQCLQCRISLNHEKHVSVATVSTYIAEVLEAKFEYNESIQKLKLALDIYEYDSNIYAQNISHILNKIGDILYQQQQFNEALEYYEKRLQLEQKNEVSKQDEEAYQLLMAQCIYNIARCLNRLHKFEESIKYFKESLELVKSTVGTEEHTGYIDTLTGLGMVHQRLNNNQESIAYLKKALTLNRKLCGNDDISSYTILAALGDGFYMNGKYNEAYYYFEDAFKLADKNYEHNHITCAEMKMAMAMCLQNNRMYDKALVYYKDALELFEKLGSKKNSLIGETLHHIGQIHSLNNVDEALSTYLKALKILNALPLDNDVHLKLCRLLADIGSLYYDNGQFDQTLEYLQQALVIQKRYSLDNLYTAELLNRIGDAVLAQCNYTSALKYYEDSVSISKNYGENLEIYVSYSNIGKLYTMNFTNFDLALEYNFKALKICESIYGSDSEPASKIFVNIAIVYEAQGNFERAEEYKKKAYDIQKRIYSHLDDHNIKSNLSLSDTISEFGGLVACEDYIKAIDYHKNALRMRKELLDHIGVCNSLSQIGFCLFKAQRYDDALKYFEESLAKCEESMSAFKESLFLADLFHNIGLVYYQLLKYDEALDYFQLSLDRSKLMLEGENHHMIADTYQSMALVLHAQERKSEALEYYNKALNISKVLYSIDSKIVKELQSSIDQIK